MDSGLGSGLSEPKFQAFERGLNIFEEEIPKCRTLGRVLACQHRAVLSGDLSYLSSISLFM